MSRTSFCPTVPAKRTAAFTAVCTAITCALSGVSAIASATDLPLGVAAGDTTSTSTVLWAKAEVAGRVRFELSTEPEFRSPWRFERRVSDPLVPAKLAVSRLRSNTTYYYRATDASGLSATGKLKTAPDLCDNSDVRFGVSGDWRGELAPYPAVRNIPSRDLDFFVKLGDTIYAENYSLPGVPTAANLTEYRAKHREVLSTRLGLNTWRDARASTSILAVIDDHEVINDFAGGASAGSDPRFDNPGGLINQTTRYRAGIQAFLEHMPINELRYGASADARTSGRPKLYRSRVYGDNAMVILLDTRSFRDKELADVTNPADPKQVAAFLQASFDPQRTMLGKTQLADLKRDLLRAKRLGLTWKFVLIPEPIQNLGVLAAADRAEGYAAERTEILKFIDDHNLENVVFVTADIHGTLVNNLSYSTGPFSPQIKVPAWEISVGSVAFDEPFGQTVVGLAAALGLVTPAQKAFYDSLPVNPDPDDTPNDKDDFLKSLVNSQLTPLGYDPLGLAGSTIPAALLKGDYVASHTYGWTEFGIDRHSKELLVTTYGIKNYSVSDLQANPSDVVGRISQVVSQFKVGAQPVIGATFSCRNADRGEIERHRDRDDD